MIIRKTSILTVVAFLLISATGAFAEHAPGERHIFRTILTIGGGFGGAVAGAYIGDTGGANWERNSVVGGVVGLSCGIVGGYLLGRKIDKSRIPKAKPDPDPQKAKQSMNRAMDLVTKEFAARFSRPNPEQPTGK
jgi:MFS family permease